MTWAQPKQTSNQAAVNTVKYDATYYKELFEKKRESHAPIRMALVGKENTAKTGLACDIALNHTDKRIVVIDCDNSAQNTVDYLLSSGVKNAENIQVLPMIDETDEAMWNEDNTTNWVAVVEKLEWFTAQIGEKLRDWPLESQDVRKVKCCSSRLGYEIDIVRLRTP